MRPFIIAAVVSTVAAAQSQIGYVDTLIHKVKPEHSFAYEAAIKKLADANRKNKGSQWLAGAVMYGEQNTYYYSTGYPSMSAIDEGNAAFERAVATALGAAGMGKIFAEINRYTASARGELRRIRPELSSTTDQAAIYKQIGQSRYYRLLMARVRPGRQLEYESQIKMIPAPPGGAARVISTSTAGVAGTVYYNVSFGKALGSFELPGLATTLGDRYSTFLRMNAENVLGTEVLILRYIPELSNPPQAAVDADPAFWNPKPPPPPAKPKATGSGQ